METTVWRVCNCGEEVEVDTYTGLGNVAMWEFICPVCNTNREGYRRKEEVAEGESYATGDVSYD